MIRERIALPFSKIPIYKCRTSDGNRKSPFDKHHSNNYCCPESSMNAKINRLKYDGKGDIRLVSKIY